MTILYITIGIIAGFIAAASVKEQPITMPRDPIGECFRIVDGGFPGVSQQTRYGLMEACLKVMIEKEGSSD